MPSLSIIYDVDGWAFHGQATALRKYAPADFTITLAKGRDDFASALGDRPTDLVFLLHGARTALVREALRQRGWPSKLVAGWSAGLPRRVGRFYQLYESADTWILNNAAYWEATGRLPGTRMIANGVDLEIFNIQRPPQQRAPKVLWTGSKLYQELKGYESLLIPLQQRLRERGIPCELLLVDSYSQDKRTPAQMAEWYNSGTVLVCASASEGTPNPALEAAACGCTVVSTRVGNMPELIRHGINGYLVDRNPEALLRAVLDACDNYQRLGETMQSDIRSWHWAERSAEFFQVFREVLAAPPRTTVSSACESEDFDSVPRPDLSSEVTVFVTTVGDPVLETCLERLRLQDCTFTLQIIDHVAPMNVAFQRMLDECRTPYYVQVDEDMLLYPHAVRTLHATLANAAPDVAMFVANLYDVHLARCILGVKIFRHDIARRYPFEAKDSFEVMHLARMRQDGYPYLKAPRGTTPEGQALGLHGTQWRPESIYERFAKLERRRRIHPGSLRWFDEYPAVFLQRFLEEPSEENFFALMGVVAGTLSSVHGEPGAKDFRNYATSPGFQHLRRFLEDFEHAPAPVEASADVPTHVPALHTRSGDTG